MNPIDYLITTIENTAKLSLSQMEDTYEKDGLIYCAKCNCPLQAWVKGPTDANGVRRERLMPVICDCIRENERIAKEQQERRDFERMLKDMRYTIGMRGYETSTFDDDDEKDEKKSDACRRYVEHWDVMKENNIGILFCGPMGTGKSFYAECIVNALSEKGVLTAIVPVSKLVSAIQSDIDRDEIYEAIRRFELLALDDLDAERATSFGIGTVYNIVNIRCECHLPTIFTTNLSLKELRQEQDRTKGRIYDRVIGMCPMVIKMNGTSRRPGIASEKQGRAKHTLEEYRMLLEDDSSLVNSAIAMSEKAKDFLRSVEQEIS